jgi:hypothetical protein
MARLTGHPGTAAAVTLVSSLPWLACGADGPRPPESQAPGVAANLVRLREDALARARFWREPPVAIGAADLRSDPPGAFKDSDLVECRYQLKLTSGLTPKFHCVLPGGLVIKVKYGRANAEPRTELAATRLLTALGFGADRMYLVKRVRCDGCPVYPHPRWGLLNRLLARDSGHVDFEDVVVEDPMPGRSIEAGEKQGWTFYELDNVDPSRGGAGRSELDALRLMAVLLADWDNKAVNQRLVCLPGGDLPDGGCSAPFGYLHDVGATFGPKGLDLEAWRATPIWADAATCRVSMKSLPYQGATFRDTVIGESGRQVLAGELKQLRTEQVRDLFTAAGFAEYMKSSEAGRNVDNWVNAFEDKVRQIADRPPCPEP